MTETVAFATLLGRCPSALDSRRKGAVEEARRVLDPFPRLPPDPQPDVDLHLRESDEIQGNILAGFNKDHQVFLFLTFPDQAAGRAWLADLLPRVATTRQVATFNEQFSQALRNRGGDDPENLTAKWVNVGLTAGGIRKLAPERDADLQGFPAFVQGPAARAAELVDEGPSAPSRWIVVQSGQDVDAVVTVAADERYDLQVEAIQASLARCWFLPSPAATFPKSSG